MAAWDVNLAGTGDFLTGNLNRNDLSHEYSSHGNELTPSRFTREDAGAAIGELQRRCADNDARRRACADEAEWLRIEAESLVSWAKGNGYLWDANGRGSARPRVIPPSVENGSIVINSKGESGRTFPVGVKPSGDQESCAWPSPAPLIG